jgi:hypothetical protein
MAKVTKIAGEASPLSFYGRAIKGSNLEEYYFIIS